MKIREINMIISFVVSLIVLLPLSSAFQGFTLYDDDGKKYFYHPDHLGSTDLVTNESSDVVEETTYKPYGSVIDGGTSRFLFTGKELDDQTGLYYYGARYYDSFFRHFTQPDSNIPDVYNPQNKLEVEK